MFQSLKQFFKDRGDYTDDSNCKRTERSSNSTASL